MRYYYCTDHQTVRGPLHYEIIRQMVLIKLLPTEFSVCKEGTEHWENYSECVFPTPMHPLTRISGANLTWQQCILITAILLGFSVVLGLLMSSHKSSPVEASVPQATASPVQRAAVSAPKKPTETAREREQRITADLYRTLAERDLRLEREAEQERRRRDAIEMEKELLRLRESNR